MGRSYLSARVLNVTDYLTDLIEIWYWNGGSIIQVTGRISFWFSSRSVTTTLRGAQIEFYRCSHRTKRCLHDILYR